MNDWRELLSISAMPRGAQSCAFRVLRKHGHDLLILPEPREAAARALTLYAAQTPFARWAKRALSLALCAGLPVPLKRTAVTIEQNDPLLAWLQEMTSEPVTPLFAIAAGNPFSQGRRYVVLAFRGREPEVVVKAGVTPEARVLIEKEAGFLERHVGLPHLPGFRGTKRCEAWSGLALEFVEGQSPSPGDTAGMRAVLRAWLDTSRPVSIDALAPWQRLATHAGAQKIVEHLSGRQVAPALFHGDFAPWNVRVEKASQHWTVIDWERGEAGGVPGWDWFHWMIHVSVLVHRHDADASADFLQAALRAPDFQEYARAAQIRGVENALLAAYLIYLHEFIVPASWSEPGRPDLKQTIASLRDVFLRQL